MTAVNPGPASSTSFNTSALYGGPSGSAPSIVVPAGQTDVQIQAAINTLNAAGGGTVFLGAGSYFLNSPVQLANNVSIVGLPPTVPPATTNLSNGWVPSNGTIIQAGTATQGFTANAANLGSTASWPVGMLSGVMLQGLTFKGFTQGGLVIGAQNAAGLVQSVLTQLFFYNCGSVGTTYTNGFPALLLKNFSEATVRDCYFASCANGLWAQCANASTDQTGNSHFDNIYVDVTAISSNFCRPIVVGVDPGVTNNALNSITLSNTDVYAGTGRTAITDTATFTGGGGNTQFTVGIASNFPVGMPVLFSTSSGSTTANWTYFVLTNAAGTLTVGPSRGGTATTNAGSGTATITQYGYPLLDIGGISTGVTASHFMGLDLEPTSGSGGGISIYMENTNTTQVSIKTLAFIAANRANIVGRNAQYNTIFSPSTALVPDFDANSLQGALLFGGRYPGIQFNQGPKGIYTFYDGTNLLNGLNVSTGNNLNAQPDLYLRGVGGSVAFLYPNVQVGQHQQSFNATHTFGTQEQGITSLDIGSTATTFTLPAMANTTLANSLVGAVFGPMTNTGSANATVKPSANTSGNFINNNSGLTNNQVVLTTGQSVTFYGSVTTGGTTYWAVVTTGTIS